jgi:D-threo-aldose 1-dehydrogenase
VGARTIAELDENLAMAGFAIPQAFWRDVRLRHLVDVRAPLPGEPQP